MADRAPSLREILEDLIALREEFADLKFNLRNRTLSVITDDIALDDIALGPFRIVLFWDRLGGAQPYDVRALQPVPAHSDASVTHPHIRNGSLCEGDGRAALRSALDQGRFYDVFVLIRQILETYNPGSAYVSLSEWTGRECSDCGRLTSEKDAVSCRHCDSELCLECSGGCSVCDETSCGECRTACMACQEWICQSCSRPCDECGEACCRTCLSSGLCPSCLESSEPEAPDFEASELASLELAPPNPESSVENPSHEPVLVEASATRDPRLPSPSAIQSLGLGQAAVPA